jgi:Tfp pilus assembly protein PilX
MHSESTLSKQQGAALLLAVVALAAIGAMVAGCFLAGWLEARSAAAARYGVAAFEAAEAGAAETIAEWDPGLSRLPLRTDSVIAAAIGSGLTDYTVTVTRLSPGTFLVRSEGRRQAN